MQDELLKVTTELQTVSTLYSRPECNKTKYYSH